MRISSTEKDGDQFSKFTFTQRIIIAIIRCIHGLRISLLKQRMPRAITLSEKAK